MTNLEKEIKDASERLDKNYQDKEVPTIYDCWEDKQDEAFIPAQDVIDEEFLNSDIDASMVYAIMKKEEEGQPLSLDEYITLILSQQAYIKASIINSERENNKLQNALNEKNAIIQSLRNCIKSQNMMLDALLKSVKRNDRYSQIIEQIIDMQNKNTSYLDKPISADRRTYIPSVEDELQSKKEELKREYTKFKNDFFSKCEF